MKKKDKEHIRTMKSEDLQSERNQLQKKLRDFTVHRTVKSVKNVREGRELRKRIAVVETVIREKEMTHES